MDVLTVVEQKSLQLSELCRKSTLVPLLITLVLQAVQNWCGVNVIVFKTVHVFQTFQTSVDSYLATAVVGGVQLLATFSKKSLGYFSFNSETRFEALNMLMTPALLCHKDTAQGTQSPLLGAFRRDFIAYGWLPCMERICYRELASAT